MLRVSSIVSRVSLIWILFATSTCHGFIGGCDKSVVISWPSHSFSLSKKHSDAPATQTRKALLNPNDERNTNRKIVKQQWASLLPATSKSILRYKNADKNAQLKLKEKVATFSSARRVGKLPVEKLVEVLDYELFRTQWFVTGNVNPAYFCKDFLYEDPENQHFLSLEEYAMEVHAQFDQSATKAEIVCIHVDDERPNLITCTWRLSGRANIFWGLDIKPLYVYTDFVVNEKNGLIQSQEDRYSLPQWDLFLSAVFPFLNGIFTAPEAPPTPPRIVTPTRNEVTPGDAFASRTRILSYLGVSSSIAVPDGLLARGTQTSTSSRDKAEFVGRSRSSQTRPVTAEEVAKMMRDDGTGSGLNVLLNLVQEGMNRHYKSISLSSKPGVPWYAALVVSDKDKNDDEEQVEVRAILADGTKVPAIRSPTWKDQVKLYLHIDHAGTVANLKEASRRAASRRYHKHYNRQPLLAAAVKNEDEGENFGTTLTDEASTNFRPTAPVSYFVSPPSWNEGTET